MNGGYKSIGEIQSWHRRKRCHCAPRWRAQRSRGKRVTKVPQPPAPSLARPPSERPPSCARGGTQVLLRVQQVTARTPGQPRATSQHYSRQSREQLLEPPPRRAESRASRLPSAPPPVVNPPQTPSSSGPSALETVNSQGIHSGVHQHGIHCAQRRALHKGLAELSLLRFLSAELTRGYFLEHNEAKYTERRERVYTCMRIPRELEKLMFFGIFLCLDAFLYVFTLLPLRVFLALFRLLTLPCYGLRDRRLLQPAQVCDILKGVILVISYFMMHYVDYSMMYHLIRGQSVIKLYIIYNMLEVADRLFSSFGQDILDALYWTATEPKERKRAHIGVIPHFFMAVLYVFLHGILIMVQATTLNVAFNSHNKSLLTIMMSNNFVEIKGSVFKKFEKNNLFQMSNSDIKERFTNYVLLLIVCLRNMEQFSWNPDHLWVLFPDVCMVVASEIAVDIVKHAFITKFNDITADVYSEYRASLAFDLVSSRQKNAYTDYSDSVARRMGFIPLPLAVLLIRVVTSSIKVQGILSYACVILFYFGLISLKILNSIVLLGKSCQYVKEAKMEEKLLSPPPASTPGKPSNKSQNKCKSSQGLSMEENLSASVTSQPVHQKENVTPLLVTSNSDQFLTTPDGDEKDITQENPELKHRSSKKDLLEIDRFTICGNRID
ncbi:transmembrane anterior posterior transformation protein 1 homolog [Fukomys damarensis]|nr:transmembrane anterior posterior transformation protein 1 homolog [Fukomys damarensis]